MKKRILSVFIIIVFLASSLQAAYVLEPSTQKASKNDLLAKTQPDKNLGKTIGNPFGQQQLDRNSYDLMNIFKLASNSRLAEASTRLDPSDISGWIASASVNGNNVQLIVGVDDNGKTSIAGLQNLLEISGARIVSTVSTKDGVKGIVVELPLSLVKSFTGEVAAIPHVSYVEPDMKVQAQAAPNDPSWGIQWGPKKIQADWAWNTTKGSSSVLVAVVDTGIDYTHPDIASNYVPGGYDWVNNDGNPMDDNGHGTHCAGIIAAVTNNSIGIAGIAQIRIMTEKVLDYSGRGTYDGVANGILNATDCGANIISMSLGGPSDSKAVHDAVKYAYNHGVLIVVAAGNSNSNAPFYPAAYDEVIAVSATDQNDNKASFSNWGQWIDLSAPGVNIYSTVPYSVNSNGYENMSGTSMACPHVSGVAALAWSMFPSKTRDWVSMWLCHTADDLGTPGFDQYYGNGRINARTAVEQTPPDHDILLQNLQTPYYVGPGDLVSLNVTALNYGSNNESSVEVQLLANSTLVDSKTISFLETGSSTTVSFSWNPTTQGTHNITVYAVPVPGEVATQNNALSAEVKVMVLSGILIVSDDDGGAKISGTSLNQFESALTAAGYSYLVWSESTQGNPTVTFLAHFGLVIWTCGDYWSWAVDQADAVTLQSYLAQGGDILLEGEDIGYNHYNDLFMVNVAHAVYAVDSASASGLTVTDPTHPVTFDLPTSFNWQTTPIYPDGVNPTNGGAEVIQYTGTTYTAVTVFDGSSIGSGSTVYYSFPLSCLGQAERDTLAVNSVAWLLGQVYEHELVAGLVAPAFLEPGYSSLLNATVRNIGLNNESDVQLELLINDAVVDSMTIPNLANGTSFTLSHLWTPAVKGIYNVTANVLPVPSENKTTNNIARKIVSVQYPLINPILGQWANYVMDMYDMSTGQLIISEYMNFTYAYYVEPYVIYITISEQYMNSTYNSWMTVNTMNRFVEQGVWVGMWYPGWVQTDITIGSTLNLLSGLTYVNGSKPIQVGGYLIDCWQIGFAPQYALYYDKASGLWTHMDFVQASYLEQLTLLSTNVPMGAPVEHELATELQAPDNVVPGASSELYATVHNIGLETEHDVALSLIIDDVTVAGEVIPALLSGESYTISYTWTPFSEGMYNVTAYVQPVSGEAYLGNNVATEFVSAQYPLINPIPGQWAYYLAEMYNVSTGQLVYSGNANFTYAYYTKPYVINITVTWSYMGYNYSYWMTVNTISRLVEKGSGVGTWYQGWVETDLTIGSVLNLLYGPTIVNGSRLVPVGGYPIDCWQVPLGPYVFYYDKASGLWIEEDYSMLPYYVEHVTLLSTNVPLGYLDTTAPPTITSPQFRFYGQKGFIIMTNATNFVVTGSSMWPSGTSASPSGLLPYIYLNMQGDVASGSIVLVQIYYDRNRAQQLGLNESTLQLYRWNMTMHLWQGIPGTVQILNSTDGTITLFLNHFSYFAVFGSPESVLGALGQGIQMLVIVGVAGVVIAVVALVAVKTKRKRTYLKIMPEAGH